MRGLNEIEALQRAWSGRGAGWSWVCDFLHDGRVPRAGVELHESYPQCDATPLVSETYVVARSPVPAAGRWSASVWMLLKLCAVCARAFGR